MNWNSGQGSAGPSRNASYPPAPNGAQNGAAAAFALRNALANPYAAQAAAYQQQQQQQQYFQQQNAWAQGMQAQPTYVTAEGYTISSTYSPSFAPPPQQMPARGRGSAPRARGGPRPSYNPGQRSQQPYHSSNNGAGPSHAHMGASRCTHEGCTFAGWHKDVEVHMMDRHLIYPPGYRKRKADWDADPSLNNGKPVPIPGTGITLDTPEAIDAWIAERKKRWPTTQRVEEKKKSLDDAVARGDLLMADPAKRSNKRRRVEQSQDDVRGGGRGRGRGRGGGRGAPTRGGRGAARGAAPASHTKAASSSSSDSDSDDDSSSSDMDPVRDAISSKKPAAEESPPSSHDEDDLQPSAKDTAPPAPATERPMLPPSKRPKQPRQPPRNPFAQRPSLLQNLLMPEIRATVSNLSQAIRFVVQNDFFDGVELKPGEADRRLIEVIEETPAAQGIMPSTASDSNTSSIA